METFSLGALPSPPDDRDYHISEVLAPEAVALPSKFFGSPVPPVLDQGTTPMCVGYSSTRMRLQQEYNDDRKWYPLDPAWLYRECKKIDGMPDTDGTWVRAAMKVLKNVGQAESIVMPLRAQTIAQHKVAAYYAIPVTTEAYIKRAVHEFGSVVIAGPWYDSWFRPNAAKGYILPTPDHEAGGHAILCNGWDDARGLLLQNSWTRAWGSNGRCFLPYRFVPGLWEAWRAVDAA
jgi:hypothetical protein